MLIIFVTDNSITSNIFRARNVDFFVNFGSRTLGRIDPTMLSHDSLQYTWESCMKSCGCSNNQVGCRRKKKEETLFLCSTNLDENIIVIVGFRVFYTGEAI